MHIKATKPASWALAPKARRKSILRIPNGLPMLSIPLRNRTAWKQPFSVPASDPANSIRRRPFFHASIRRKWNSSLDVRLLQCGCARSPLILKWERNGMLFMLLLTIGENRYLRHSFSSLTTVFMGLQKECFSA